MLHRRKAGPQVWQEQAPGKGVPAHIMPYHLTGKGDPAHKMPYHLTGKTRVCNFNPEPFGKYSTVQCSAVQYSTVQYSTVQYSTVQYSTVQYSTVQYSMVQYGTVWYYAVQHPTGLNHPNQGGSKNQLYRCPPCTVLSCTLLYCTAPGIVHGNCMVPTCRSNSKAFCALP